MKPLTCAHCGHTFPDVPEVIGVVMGGHVEVKCSCGAASQVPWGRCPLWMIEKAREAEAKK